MAITIWEWTGVTLILYLAAMAQIDPEVLEAARLELFRGLGEDDLLALADSFAPASCSVRTSLAA